MKIPGYPNWFTVFRPLRWLVPLAEQAYDVAGIFLAADTPIVCTGHCISAAERDAIQSLLDSQASAHAPVLHSPKPEDAAEGPPPIASDSVSGGGHPKTEDIPDEYWDDWPNGDWPEHPMAENARLRRELDAARQERDNANARANAGRLAP